MPITVHSEQPPVNTTPSVETSPTHVDAVLDTTGPSTHQVRQESEHVDYSLFPVASASSHPPSHRRSGRKRRAPDRYGAKMIRAQSSQATSSMHLEHGQLVKWCVKAAAGHRCQVKVDSHLKIGIKEFSEVILKAIGRLRWARASPDQGIYKTNDTV